MTLKERQAILENNNDVDVSKISNCILHSTEECENQCEKYNKCKIIAKADDLLIEWQWEKIKKYLNVIIDLNDVKNIDFSQMPLNKFQKQYVESHCFGEMPNKLEEKLILTLLKRINNYVTVVFSNASGSNAFGTICKIKYKITLEKTDWDTATLSVSTFVPNLYMWLLNGYSVYFE